jgi:molybdopterin adenylyltransferase
MHFDFETIRFKAYDRRMTAQTSGTESHRAAAPKTIRVAVLTISDTRNLETDSSGGFLKESLEAQGHTITGYQIVKDDGGAIRAQLLTWLEDGVTQVVLTTGGTGITKRDNTIPIIESLLEKPLPGFGELFRMLSFAEVGAAAVLSRATGGLAKGGQCLLFAMPGSFNAVKTAWDGIFEHELEHMVFEILR